MFKLSKSSVNKQAQSLIILFKIRYAYYYNKTSNLSPL
jgi:hypothetical protein